MLIFYFIILLILGIFHTELHTLELGKSGAKTTGVDLILFISLLMSVIRLFTRGKDVRKIFSYREMKIYMFFFAFSLISLVIGLNKNGMVAFGEYRIVLYSLFYLTTLILIKNERDINKFIKMFITLTIILFFTSISNYLNILSDSKSGAFNYFTHINRGDAILFISLFPFFIIVSLIYNKKIRFKSTKIIATVLFLSMIVVSQVRSTILTTGVSLLLLLMFVKFKYKLRVIFGFIIMVGMGLYLYISFTPTDVLQANVVRYSAFVDYESDVNSMFRVVGIATTIGIIQSNPIIGQPFGDSIDFYFEKTYYSRFDPHNSYLYLGAKTGLVGLAIFISIIIICLIRLLKIINKESDNSENVSTKINAVFLFLSIISFSVFIAFNASLRNDSSGLFFWIFLALATALINIEKDQISKESN